MPICRLCLYEGNDKQLVLVWNNNHKMQNLAKRIKDCVSVDIRKSDRVSTWVCFQCIEHVTQWETFKNQCQKSNDVLLERLTENENIRNKEHLKNQLIHADIKADTGDIKNAIEDDESESDYSAEEFEERNDKALKLEFLDGLEDLDLKPFTTNNTYTCEICAKQFNDCIDYLDHQEIHDGQPVFSCDKCNEIFSYRRDLILHDQNHKVACLQCGKMIAKSSMKMHLIIHTDKYKCGKCGGTFNSKAALSTHTIQVHTDIKNHVCDSCGKLFSCQASLRVHLRIHSDERLYKCKQCSYSGRTASALYAHMSTHANDLCVCEYCPKTFKSSRNLGDHLRRVHSKEKKHRCSYCDKRFVDKYMLSVHKRWHTGDRPYKCTLCEKAFIRSDGLKEHMVTHNPRTKYDCKHCGKKFTTKRSVVRHICSAATTA